jgi:predicted glycoside hydrolase/deacetylase ChbG (UPF0249 family)
MVDSDFPGEIAAEAVGFSQRYIRHQARFAKAELRPTHGMQRTIVFTADDLGLDEETNLAIERAHRQGALTAASLMMGQPGSAHAVEVARSNPALQIGWHFHACDSQPLTRRRWPWGNSAALVGLTLAFWPPARALIRRELRAQWDQFMATGLPCHFINGHHHLNIHPFIAREMFQVVSATFTGWARGLDARFFGDNPRGNLAFGLLSRRSTHWLKAWPANRRSHSLWGLDRTFCMKASEVAEVLPTLPEGLHEFMFHPRREGDADQTALLELQKLQPGIGRPNNS